MEALRQIGEIVAQEQRADYEKARLLRWSARYGWLLLAGIALVLSFAYGLI